jgi:hypothetical protein
MSSVGIVSSLLAALPAESYLVLPPGFSPLAAKVDDSVFLLACVPPLNNKEGSSVHYAVQRYRFAPLLAVMEKEERATEKEYSLAVGEALVESDGAPPAVDAILYAYLLSSHGVNYVLQGVSVAVNQILCSPRAREFAKHRILPEETMACGLSSVFVPYADPGLPIAQAVKCNLESHRSSVVSQVKVLLLQNRGFMVLGTTNWEVLRAYFTLEKTAQVWVGASLLGGPTFLTAPNVMRLVQISEQPHNLKLSESSTINQQHRDLGPLNYAEKEVKGNNLTFSEKSEDKMPPKDLSSQGKAIVVREDVPLFEEDKASSHRGKLNFTRGSSSNDA